MKKSKLSQTTVRRRPRSSGEELPERPPAKQHRYPGILFAYGAYPTKLRVNIYSKSHVIGSVAAALKGTDAMDTLMASQFWGLFQLPVVRCQNSTKLIGCLLSRQLVTARRHELWFTFGPDPLRFSLDEFRDVTGLNCGDFDVQDSEASESVPPTMWNKLFDTAVGKLTVLSVLRMLGNEYLAVEKRIPLALIALVDGVLCPSNKDLKLTPRYIEMLSDVESFLVYPWGRESFLTTVPRFLPPLVVAPGENPLQVMRDRLSQKTTVCYGFPLALQLFVFDVLALRRPLFSQSTK
ncbi:BnaCnng22110D [Brassica napus]|uniref:BnaCnng22110D protein n=2 Tax=Brassica napus TaxID=3708 RepID=A0A078IT27_BRANA|nr:BnaCnng22110D [Brassica napus]